MNDMLSFSGGKDSTAILLELYNRDKLPNKIIFADTLMEFPEMYDFIDEIEAFIRKPIIKTKPRNNFFEWFFGTWTSGKNKGEIRGFPKTTLPCWYQREAKTLPMKPFVDSSKIVYVGYCKGEDRELKDNRFHYPLKEWGWDSKKTRKVCMQYGFLNPLYKKFDRLGCWCCPKQCRYSLMILQRDYPSLWNIIKQLEKISPNGFGLNDTSDLPRNIFTWTGKDNSLPPAQTGIPEGVS